MLTREELHEATRYAGDAARWRAIMLIEKRYVHLFRRRFNGLNPDAADAFRVAVQAVFAAEASQQVASDLKAFVTEEFEDAPDLTGEAAESECRARGWYCQDGFGPDSRFGSFCPCDADAPGAMVDLNRLAHFKAYGADTLYDGCTRQPRTA